MGMCPGVSLKNFKSGPSHTLTFYVIALLLSVIVTKTVDLYGMCVF